MKIGTLELSGRTVLAPLAGITNVPFRKIVKECGCALVCSEMVSAKGIVYDTGKSKDLLDSVEEERPLSIQLFGSCPVSMEKAARYVEKIGTGDIIDINFGCSVKKVLKTGAGAALMKESQLASDVISAVRQTVDLPVTIKIRSGWDRSGKDAFRVGEIAERAGVDAVALHPRTARQAFTGTADWDLIRRLKAHLSIPVIGNGDITCAEDGVEMIRRTGCDAVMVGRAAMGDPLIFSRIEALLDGQEPVPFDRYRMFPVMRRLVESYKGYFTDDHAARMLRSRLVWFVKGVFGATVFKRKAARIQSCAEAFALIDEFESFLESHDKA